MNQTLSIVASLLLGLVATIIAHYSGRWRRTVAGVLLLVGFLLLLPLVLMDPASRDMPVFLILPSSFAGVALALIGAYALLSAGRDS